jgi:long-chain fatty acid transport protein
VRRGGGGPNAGGGVWPAHPTPRIPAAPRTCRAGAGQYRLGKASAIDFGYAHLFVNDPGLQSTANGTTLTGEYDSAVDIVSAQYTHSF